MRRITPITILAVALAVAHETALVPRTADGSERWLAATRSEPEHAVPTTADGTVRWTTHATHYAVPRTADGTLGWFAYLTPRVPRTADGTERWLRSR